MPDQNPHSETKGIAAFRPIRVFVNSWNGLRETFKSDLGVRYKLILLPFAVGFAWYADIDSAQKALLIITAFSTLIAELINSAIESVIDKVSPNYSFLAKKAKDIGSAIVYLTFICTIIVWYMILKA